MNNRFSWRWLSLAGSAAMLALVGINVSQAQEAAEAASAVSLDEVIVTARRSEA